MNTKEEYNSIARDYENSRERELARFVLYPSFISSLGNIDGFDALDLACGEGKSTRLLKELGTDKVVGIDLSDKLIEIAKKKEAILKQGIEYHVGDISKMDFTQLGSFDLVTAVMLLNYISSKDKIDQILSGIYHSLKRNSVFVATIPNPNISSDIERYGIKLEFNIFEEGAPYKVTLSDFDGNQFCKFTNYYWKRKTYEELFENSGFNFEWLPIIISEEGLKKYGQPFWKEFRDNPIYSISRLKK